jgi:broad specificity phosphatase PhoE
MSAACQRLEVLWVRHGHGCHNAIRHQGAGFFAQINYPDPFLTNCGKIMTERNGEKAKEILDALDWSPEHVFSSALLRAIETATIMFPGSTVQPLPFIGEKGFGLLVGNLNTARTPEEQQAILPDASLDYRFLPDEKIELKDKRAYYHKYSADRSRKASSHKAWRAFFAEQVMPELLQGHDSNLPLRVAIVSHKHFIKDMIQDFFFCSAHKPQNNEAVLLKYDYNPQTKKLFEVLGEDESPDDACGYPLENQMTSQWHEEYLCLKDYDNCYEHGGREVMKVNEATGESGIINDAEAGQMCCSDQP